MSVACVSWRPSGSRPFLLIVRFGVHARKPVSTRESMTNRQSSMPSDQSRTACGRVNSISGISRKSRRTRSTTLAKLMSVFWSNLRARWRHAREPALCGFFQAFPRGSRWTCEIADQQECRNSKYSILNCLLSTKRDAAIHGKLLRQSRAVILLRRARSQSRPTPAEVRRES